MRREVRLRDEVHIQTRIPSRRPRSRFRLRQVPGQSRLGHGKIQKVMKCDPFTLDRLKAVYAGELCEENKNS